MSFSSYASTSTDVRRFPPSSKPQGATVVHRNPGIVVTQPTFDTDSSFRAPNRPLTLHVDDVNTLAVLQPEPLSVSPHINVTYLKRRYSREDSLLGMEMPIFDKSNMKVQKKGPSSPATVLTMAGLFICGVTLLLSGIIVLIQQREREFLITGGIFIGVGVLMVLTSLILQRKNIQKFVLDLNRDLYFINANKQRLEERNDLPIPNSD